MKKCIEIFVKYAEKFEEICNTIAHYVFKTRNLWNIQSSFTSGDCTGLGSKANFFLPLVTTFVGFCVTPSSRFMLLMSYGQCHQLQMW